MLFFCNRVCGRIILRAFAGNFARKIDVRFQDEPSLLVAQAIFVSLLDNLGYFERIITVTTGEYDDQ
ncbi:hypothetical protein ACFFQF_17125 [Haladaptatus pallidirubidus]|uniref:Uncharacterized protein n=1 Tax=Haladaptatus pallidirubidus TaxID=1008152 RepID=A0AAV3US20_9EURY|nr:hypothetical protein [Haladaptatus pallidirubidus]